MVDQPLFAGLISNGALLVGLVLVTVFLRESSLRHRPWIRRVLSGCVIALLGVGVMLVPVAYSPGLVFDVRSVLLSLAGLFYGAVPTAIAVVATATLRWFQGGVGAPVGIAVIAASALIGIAWRQFARGRLERLRTVELYALGMLTHVVMVAILATLPQPLAGRFVREVAGLVLVLFPVLTVVVGRLVVSRMAHDRAADALAASEAGFRQIFDHSHAIMLVVDPATGEIVDANAAAAAYYGWRTGDLRGMPIGQIDVVIPAEIDGVRGSANGRSSGGVTTRHRRRDGSVRDVEVYSGPIERAGRDLVYSLVIDVQDMRDAARKEQVEAERRAAEQESLAEHQRRARLAAVSLAEEALRSQRELRGALGQLELLMEHVPAAIAMLDRDLRYLAVSRRWVTDYALDGTDLVGKVHGEVFPELPERWRAVHLRALEGAVESSDADWFDRLDGRRMWQRWEVRPWFDHDGAIGGILIFSEDITETMVAREQLTKLSRAVEQSPESIVITSKDARIEYVNDAFVAASGYARDELIGRNPRVLNSGRTPRATYESMWRALTAGETWKGEFVNRRKDGREYVELATISPIVGPDGEVTHYLAVKEDVTAKKRMADELDQYRHHLESLVAERTAELTSAREQADVANHAKTTFLATMSHEIRTPLNAIVGLTHLLLRDEPSAQQRERLTKVETSSRHLLSIVSDVLDLAKIESGKIVIERRPFHPSSVLDNVRSIVHAGAEAKGVTVAVDAGALPSWLIGDPIRLRQALLNLAGNAVKFTERGSIRLRAVVVDDAADGVVVRFEVEDTGIGIAEDLVPQLFQPFEQLDAAVTREYGGTGLGLAITRRLAELMGGTVGVESEPGRGSRFWFTARVARATEAPSAPPEGWAPAERAPLESFAGARVLLAEDHPINREVAREILRGFGLDVVEAEHGAQALDLARGATFDLVLMDVQMPRMNGLDAARAMRALPAYDSVPILAMTANAFEEDRQACFAAGMDDFIAKPIDVGVLRRVLARWLGGRGTAAALPASEPPAWQEGAPTDAALSALASSGSVDVDQGLSVVNGDPVRYASLLRRFAVAHAHDVVQLKRELSYGDVEAARRRLHALKGVAGTLGARRLHAAAAELERALGGHGPPAEHLVDGVERELDALVTRLESPPASSDVAVGPAVRVAHDRTAVLARLAELLEHDDPDARTFVAAHRDAVSEDVVAAVERFDYMRARAILAQTE